VLPSRVVSAGATADAVERPTGSGPAAVVIVEGASDGAALAALAARRGVKLAAEGIELLALGGYGNLGRELERLAPRRSEIRLAGLCDAAEAPHLRRALARAGFGANLTVAEMERLGFYLCVADLEDELIRALGPAEVQAVLAAEGDLPSFRTFQNQPAQRGRPVERQLRRFMGTQAGRKAKYARRLVDALDLDRAPRPLDGALAHVRGGD